MRTIHKFIVPFASQAVNELPPMPANPAAPIRFVGLDPRSGLPAVWIEVHTDDNPDPGRRMVVYGTGHEIPPDLTYVGSLIDGSFVWHVFEQPVVTQ